MSDMEIVFKKIDGYRDEVIRMQTELTSKAALGPKNGGTGEHEKAAYLEKELKALKPDFFQEIKAPDESAHGGYRPSLAARWKGEEDGPVVWVLSHMDIVPPGDLSLWGGDPYKVRVEGELLIGRGVEDNQHGIVSSILGLKALLGSGKTPKRPVGLIMAADEETGSEYGLDYILKNHGGLFNPDDLIIVPDGGNEDGTMIEVAEKSMLWLRFTVTGRQCHGSTPQKGNNSLYGAARMILALDQLKSEFTIMDELFSPPGSTFEATKMEANVPNINTIPGKNVFYMDCRIMPDYRVDDVLRTAEALGKEIAEELGLSVFVEPVYRQDAENPTSPDAPVVKALAKAVKRITGRDAVPMGIGGGTVAAFFRQAGLPAAVWLSMPDSAHQPNEYCPIG
ncbi:MAG: M20 family metallo-hydrolase, partial [Pseudomonadota bacterium]